jgi:hypothetical protein
MRVSFDVYRTAWTLIRVHGEAAPTMAALRRDSLMCQGDRDGVEMWRGVVRAVDELQATQPKGALQ